jgi:Flp pilus assembly protein TadD
MPHLLVEIQRKALQFKNSGRIAEAAELFSVIVEEQPNWEHGNAVHDLAQCYEELGCLELAEKFYRAALDYGPTNDIFLGGLASFLYLHGKPEDAFDAHVKLLQAERSQGFDTGIETTMIALNALAKRLGWSRDMIAEKIANNTA